MTERYATKLTEQELQRLQEETGVDVYALLELMARTPTERLNIAVANARNLARLLAATRRITSTT